ncbi:MAG: sigma-70 family RNA polymerase sigma factor [Acidobacteria bacterium]|nr:sigma-70 family RNA polymerase sigma factor [Acidobacteriota bacterium]
MIRARQERAGLTIRARRDRCRPRPSGARRRLKSGHARSAPGEDRLQDTPALAALSDEELVSRAAGGDTDCFNQLIIRWERPIYALAFRTLGREDDARDVSQETFLRAFRALPGFKGESKFSSWLYRIALNLCRDQMRRQRRAPFVPTPAGVDLVELAGEGEGAESLDEIVGRRRLGEAVQRAMRLLPEEQRTAVVLKEYEGLTFQEIADLVGCPLSTVKTRLYQGLTVLRRELERNGISGLDAGRPDEARRSGRARAV